MPNYVPGETPYPYRDCRKELKKVGDEACDYRRADREERLGAQVDMLRMALETIAVDWLDGNGERGNSLDLAAQRDEDQRLARYALRRARQLDDDRFR